MNFRNEALLTSASNGGKKIMDFETLWNEEELETLEELNEIFNL